MNTAVAERVALPEGVRENQVGKDEGRKYLGIVSRGQTDWHVYFIFNDGPLRERMILDGEPFHRPATAIYKGMPDWRQRQTWHDDAPRYVQKYIEDTFWQVAEFEQRRHGVRPMTHAEHEAEAEREYLRRQEIIKLIARDVRDAAPCGTPNSESIAEWILTRFVDKREVDDMIREFREDRDEAVQSAANERESAEWAEKELAKVRERCDELADEARRLLTTIGAFGAPLVSDPLAYAVGNSPLEKVADLSRDLLAALGAYDMGAE